MDRALSSSRCESLSDVVDGTLLPRARCLCGREQSERQVEMFVAPPDPSRHERFRVAGRCWVDQVGGDIDNELRVAEVRCEPGAELTGMNPPRISQWLES